MYASSILLLLLLVQPSPIDAARVGGVTIVCRHAITDHSRDDAREVRYDDLSTQRLLSPEGERQSEEMGEAFRALGIRVSDVVASPMNRALRTAELMFGTVRIDSIWYTADNDYGGARLEARRRVLSEPIDVGVRVIVSHVRTIESALPAVRNRLREGDCAVVRPSGSDYRMIGIVPWRAWRDAAGRQRTMATAPWTGSPAWYRRRG